MSIVTHAARGDGTNPDGERGPPITDQVPARLPRRHPEVAPASLQSSSRHWARLGAGGIALVLLASFATLPYSMAWHNVQEWGVAVRHAPSWAPMVPLEHYVGSPSGFVYADATFAAHRASSWFGHDDLGRSLFYRVMLGFLVSVGTGVVAASMAVGIGVTWGVVAAFVGGRVDLLMMRFVDVLYGLPYTLMVIVLKIALTRPLTVLFAGGTRYAELAVLVVAIGGVGWLTMARVIRGQVLSLRSQPFIEAAQAAGAGPMHIIIRHVLPHLAGTIIVYATLAIPQAVLQESFLSFLGIGVRQPMPSLGRLAADGIQAVNTFVAYWWLIVFPCGALVLTLLSLNVIGDALRTRIAPKSSAATLA